jgi:lactoylglutathione lyase
MIRKLNSINVYVEDQERALHYYRDVLGFAVNDDRQAGPGFRWVSVSPPDSETKLMLYHVTPDMHDKWNKRGTWSGIVFFTDDLDGDVRELRQRGAIITADPSDREWGAARPSSPIQTETASNSSRLPALWPNAKTV